MSSKPKTRRLPDTYNSEVTRSVPPRGGKSVINPEQFLFLGETEHLSPTGDPKTSRKLHELRFMGDAVHLVRDELTRGQLQSERYRG